VDKFVESFNVCILLAGLRKFILSFITKLYKMKPELILKAEILDIIFENRNKEYGAYELRTHYENRLRKSIMIIFFVTTTIIILGIWFRKTNTVQTQRAMFGPDVTLSEVSIVQMPEVVPLKPKASMPAKKLATIQNVKPLIVKDNVEVNPPPLNSELVNAQIGTQTLQGVTAGPDAPALNGNESSTGGQVSEQQATAPVETVLIKSDVMPEFPGGLSALLKYLQKNLRMPKDNLEAGSIFSVKVRFIVDKDGEVTGISVLQSAGKDFDEEVMRVVKKMPKWKPGMQQGNRVAVYYNLPVTFQVPGD